MGNVPFRYDFVGSFLRPQALKDAKEALDNGKLSQEDYDHIVDEEVVKVIQTLKQKAIIDQDIQAIKLFLEYYLGKPKETIETTHNLKNFNIKDIITFKGDVSDK